MFRIVPLLVLVVGVSAWRRDDHHGNTAHKRPIITPSQQQRICADLCRSGLGGEPCGEVCFDLLPTGFPLQLTDSNITKDVKPVQVRSDVCPVLCENRLGYPLCQCKAKPEPVVNDRKSKKPKKFRVDFNRICDHYCESQRWSLHGCPDCPTAPVRQDGLQELFKQDGAKLAMLLPGTTFQSMPETRQIDWGKWCKTQCANSNGGSACNCDILPFSI